MSSPTFPRSKLLPFRDPLRGDPRFEKIVVKAPKRDVGLRACS